MTLEQRDRLILRYLDQQASADEVVALGELLQSDADARDTLCETAWQAVAVADFARERLMLSPPQVPKSLSLAAPRRWRWAASAAACLLIFVGVAFWLMGNSPQILRIGHIVGAVSYTPEGAEVSSGLKAHDRLPAGTCTVEGAASSVQLIFDDGTSITLAGDAELAILPGQQKRLTLRSGSLSADVRPQATDKPLMIRTPTAELEVLGTEFQLAAQNEQTALSVESGTVRLRRLADGTAVNVPPGEAAVASLDTTEQMRSRQLPTTPAEMRQVFADRATSDSWQGEWLPPDASNPSRMRGVLNISERNSAGKPIAAYTVNLRDNAAGIVKVSPQSRLRLRLRTEGRSTVIAIVGVHHPTGGFAGNFQTNIQHDAGTPDADG